MSERPIISEKPVAIPVEGGEVTLEGLFGEGRIGRSVVLCHPHPLYGGDMHNNVVQAARQTFVGLGWRTLRFNFRGAGSSGGQAGKGQKDAGDLIAVSKFIRAVSPGRIDFASYSYGAWVTMEAIRMGLSADSLILISPPLDFTSFEGLDLPDVPTLIVIGNKDGFCQVSSLTNWLSGQVCARSPALEILSGVDHFYRGAERLLSAKIADFLKVRNIAPRTAE